MSPLRWAVSLLIVLHLAAVWFGAVPPPSRLRPVAPPRGPDEGVLVRLLTPALDTAAAFLYRASSGIWQATAPLPEYARLYLGSMGLGQQWTMFADPSKNDEYVRLRYYVSRQTESRPAWVATQLVLPVERDDEFRLVRSYWTKQRDKAISSAMDRFIAKSKLLTPSADPRPGELPTDLQPMSRYFAREFVRQHLTAAERLLRTEVWFGTAPIPSRGTEHDPSVLADRLAALSHYYQGPLEDHLPDERYPAYQATEGESDITWVLEYFEEP